MIFIALIVTGSQDNQILVHSMDPDIQGNNIHWLLL